VIAGKNRSFESQAIRQPQVKFKSVVKTTKRKKENKEKYAKIFSVTWLCFGYFFNVISIVETILDLVSPSRGGISQSQSRFC
jgi:hypothetical protein